MCIRDSSYTGSMSDAQNNPEFEGYATFTGEYRNRDYRFVGCAFLPDRVSVSYTHLKYRTNKISVEECKRLAEKLEIVMHREKPCLLYTSRCV